MATSVGNAIAKPLSGKPHPEVRAYLDAMAAMNPPPIETLPPQAVRAGFKQQMMQGVGPTTPLPDVRELAVPGRAGALPARLYRPRAGSLGALLFLHGGGWVIGDLETHDDLCRDLAAQSGCAVLALDYRLAPEHPFPAAVDDTLAALEWLHASAGELDLDPARIAIGGDSAGGNLAAVACLEERALGGPRAAAQVLIYPVTDLTRFDTPSHAACAQGYGLTSTAVEWFRDQYCGAQRARSVRVSPAHALDLRGVPPALVVTAEYDVLRSEGETYAQRLEEAGVPTTLLRYDGMIHGFVSMAGILSVGRQARADIAAWLRGQIGG
jgi:acetyl esterase